MPKALVACCDGTWDRPGESSGGAVTCTNVFKLYKGLAHESERGEPQIPYYHEGVGTGGRLDRVFGGAFGAGLARNVLDCYRFLALNYEPGDRVYLFGFSRGAYTARSTAGMVRNCGILRPRYLGHIGEAFQLYRDRGDDTSPASRRAEEFRRRYASDVDVHFVGVWDTVGSLGVPVPIPFFRPWWAFHDTELSSTVRHAYHAVAIDERRRPFTPTLWTRTSEPPTQTLEQVWFAGVHRDVGGGYRDPDLADVTLDWMVHRARACELAFKPDHFIRSATDPDDDRRYEGSVIHPDPMGELHDSRQGAWKAIPALARHIPPATEKGYERSRQSASSTAVARHAAGGYDPSTLTDYLAGPHEETSVPEGP